MSCHDGAGPRMQPRKLLDAASTVLHFAHQCSQTNVIQQLQLARNDILVVVSTINACARDRVPHILLVPLTVITLTIGMLVYNSTGFAVE